MAEEALKRLEEQLCCSICLDTYTDPKLLQCFHVYCRQCLVLLVVREQDVGDQQGRLTISCPTCRQVTPIPDRGVAGLQPAFHINHLLEILQDSVKQLRSSATAVTPEEAVGGTDVGSHGEKETSVDNLKAHLHLEEMELYCQTCEELINYKSALKGGKHHDHDYEELNQAFEKYKEELTSSLEPMEKQVTIVKKALEKLNARRGEISDQRATIESNIHVTFGQLREILTVRETELIGQLHHMTQVKLKGLASQSDQIETTLAQLNSCLYFMRESLRTGSKSDVMMTKTNTITKVKELTTPLQPDLLKPNTEADILFSALADMTKMCQDYGQVLLPSSPDPSSCYLSGIGEEEVGKEAMAFLHILNCSGKLCEEEVELKCELTSEIIGSRSSCDVERTGSGQYKIRYQAIMKGRHQLHIKMEGQHVRGSPFSVAVKSSRENFSYPILSPLSDVLRPWGVVINKRGEIIVTEKSRYRVIVFSPSGEKLRSFGRYGEGEGQFIDPRGVTVDGEGNILVADSSNHRIQKFTAEGKFLTAVGSKGPLQFTALTDIAFNVSNNKIYIINEGIQVLNSNLTFSCSFGRHGSEKGNFSDPRGIACDRSGRVYVADTDNHRVQVFTAEGKLLRVVGKHGQGSGELDNPICVAVDTSGMIYVSEGGNCRVSVFTSEGQFVTSFGMRGEGPGEFNFPYGLAVDNGVVCVCDYTNKRVQVF